MMVVMALNEWWLILALPVYVAILAAAYVIGRTFALYIMIRWTSRRTIRRQRKYGEKAEERHVQGQDRP